MLYFLQDASGPELSVVARRGAAATRDAKRAELWFRSRFEDYQQLVSLLEDAPGVPVALAWQAGQRIVGQAEEEARAQRRRHNLNRAPVRDVRAHLDDGIGTPVFYREVEDREFCGMLIVGERLSAAAMLVNSRLLPSRRNFTMAHEYGHLLWKLKRQEPTDDVFYRNPVESDEEMFANAFAASFLVPDAALTDRGRAPGARPTDAHGVMELAEWFGVSYQMITYRLQNTGLLSEEDARRLRDLGRPVPVSGLDWDERAFPDMSPRFRRLVLEAYQRDLLEASRCAEMLGMSPGVFDELLDELTTASEEEVVSGDALLATG